MDFELSLMIDLIKILDLIFMNMRLKMFAKFDSWGLIEKRVEKESKCPFKFMWNKWI